MKLAFALAVLLAAPAFANGTTAEPPKKDPPAVEVTPRPEQPRVPDFKSSTVPGSDRGPVQSTPFALCCIKRPGLVYCTPGETPDVQPVEERCPWYMHPANDVWALWGR